MGWGQGRQGAGGIEKGPEETFWGDRNVHSLDSGDCSTITYLKVTKLYTLNILYVNYMQ